MLRLFLLTGIVAFAVARGPASAAGLPEGEGRDVVEAICTACHGTNQIMRSSGYTADDWRELIGTMIDLSGGPEEQRQIVGYLATHFPPNERRTATLVPGDVEIAFTEWVVPTLGQRARDPVEASDGSIWWVGQWGNLVGRIDPETGAMTEYPLPGEARPHSVTLDGVGNAWYTGNGDGTIGKLDAATGEITVYPMPDPAARDPHTAEFDHDGILWFTLQQSNMIGRLDPATGNVKLVSPKTPGARPYGIKIDSDGVPWVACNGSNCLLRVDPATMEVTEIELPLPDSTVRRLDIAEDGMIWYVNSRKGRLGRYDPGTGKIDEWPSPSGPDSHPYAIAVVDGIVWYNESGVRPDALVRFDPRDETFQSWAVPSGNVHAGIVRHMRRTADGDLLIHQSSTNRIIRVSLPDVLN
ncbi:Vgb family protein [Oceanibacterium hippocampi]|uniref:Virginiamycin B lyase n=1 Tax=Oceanibacterium hippocampi TaxID=745714 RepID=A0A1Y5TNY0_9PROT|nr:cytochrome C [Oceanibacterium hippocampi]SLN66355.1 Virginiamycin B lyase [Oceanibacterium hippocampi]